jgi:hypothetical protein
MIRYLLVCLALSLLPICQAQDTIASPRMQSAEIDLQLAQLKSDDESKQVVAARKLSKYIEAGVIAKREAKVLAGLKELLLAGRCDVSSAAHWALRWRRCLPE